MINFKLFKDITKKTEDGTVKGLKINEAPQFELQDTIKKLRKEFNEFTKRIIPENWKLYKVDDNWQNSGYYKQYFWNQIKHDTVYMKGISLWLSVREDGIRLQFGTTDEYIQNNRKKINHEIYSKYNDLNFEKFKQTDEWDYLNFLYTGNDCDEDIEYFRNALEALCKKYIEYINYKQLDLLTGDADMFGRFRDWALNEAVRDNGNNYAEGSIDSYITYLRTTIPNQLNMQTDMSILNKQEIQDIIDSCYEGDLSEWNRLKHSTPINALKLYLRFLNNITLVTQDRPNHIKNILLYGVPGVGKTHNTKKLIDLIEQGKSEQEIFETISKNEPFIHTTMSQDLKSRVKFVTFHQSFGYEDFIEGFRPNEKGDIELQKGIFKTICEEASENRDQNYYLVIDEINRGNISKIFGELITLIEEDKRDTLEATLPYSKKSFSIPSNLFIIGTMNSTDKSIALIDIALRRRFTFVKMLPNYELIHHSKSKSLLTSINEKIKTRLGEDYQIGHSYFMEIKNDANLSFVIKYKIKPLLEEYFYGDNDGLNDILALMDT